MKTESKLTGETKMKTESKLTGETKMTEVEELFLGIADSIYSYLNTTDDPDVRKVFRELSDGQRHDIIGIKYNDLEFRLSKRCDGQVVHYCLEHHISFRHYKGKLFYVTHRGKGILKNIWDRCEEIIETSGDGDIDVSIPAPYEAVIYHLDKLFNTQQ